ncbi:MAG: hypothetical protein MPEBLZ_02894 [Candidatus Methanoperedens nitroreducens]|uniref:DUF4143 domain-containing protein n=1 Tax=Candidatus Methanoperedens nitratireducens TaxID=1392998 RepID=A0A0P7ZG19_9EURY|nr:DUF4143 domain-containing protein [Candidatus Methanoperedens sp. BLZ2]KAB2945773.1 MAG: DUF4143 domain-containing protein [Candidatus Methanoperedens sp.]KPQ42548.1 MAG: hypothetical protein MPEBLZ_02894 [Candidatus Methanoperedens sp. BLZ1]MBZ0174269.1 DUF4143 domain-containing protein [Candidatus Methanoperedens nitroreducens]CAG0987087.1 hypothetical protein METP2_02339 [Methanosarcinales archaeon]MCX9077320.1 DUF4143 domain-containing protein [Candidatus Methanoperedens sp.]
MGIKDKDIIRKYIKESIVEKVIYRDLPQLFQIKDIGVLESLLEIIMEEPGQLIELTDLSKELKVSRHTLSNYFFYLEDFKDDNISKSKAFEWLVVTRLNAEFFWRDPYKNEVDVIIAQNNPIPLEIKYGKIDTTGLIVFMRKFKVNEGYIISHVREDSLKVDNNMIKIIPAFKYFLMKT